MWISNVATTVMMLPIALAVVKSLEGRFGAERARPLSVNLLLGIAFASSIGGVATLVGTPTNLAFVKIHAASFPTAAPVSFGQWFLVGLPVAIVGLIVAWWVMTRVASRVPPGIEVDAEVVKRELRALGHASYEERVVILVGTTTAFLWIFRGDLVLGAFTLPGWARLSPLFVKIDDSTVAVAMALVLFVWPSRQKPGQAILSAAAFKDLPWGAILLFGGGFALADGFVSSGFTAHLAGVFGAIDGVPAWATVLLGCLGVAVVTEFVSNIATVQMFMPVLASLAVARGIDPLVMMIPATMTSSMAFMFPVGTPPNAVVFGSERLRVADMVRVGLLVKVALLVVTIAFSMMLVPIVFQGVAR
jgi:sodium-dependent dicarboxylate transporter 2/3/5